MYILYIGLFSVTLATQEEAPVDNDNSMFEGYSDQGNYNLFNSLELSQKYVDVRTLSRIISTIITETLYYIYNLPVANNSTVVFVRNRVDSSYLRNSVAHCYKYLLPKYAEQRLLGLL